MDTEKNAYEIAFQRATNPSTRDDFWKEQAQQIDWYQFPQTILDQTNPPFYKWFPDGLLNICHLCIDRHLETIPDQKAICWESGMLNNKSKSYTFREFHDHVSKLAGVMKQLGVRKGDRVIIYMPMIAEGLFAMLASARIGAIHSVVFGGFSATELASRIIDCQPALIVCASCGFEPNKIIDYKAILNEALEISSHQNLATIVVQRPEHPTSLLLPERDYDYHTAMKFATPAPCEPVNGSHPLYILYTSGTTGQPKGIVRDQGGTAVALHWTMKHIMGIKRGDVYFSASDIGWVVGHSFGVYGPLIMGATTVVYEGKPTGTPDPGQYWRIVEKHKVNGFYTSPTGLRALRREDPHGEWMKKYNTSSLQNVSMAGERCDVPTYEWIRDNLGVLINDNYWQTEAGWIISCNYKDLYTFKPKPGSATKPAPGFEVKIMDHHNEEIKEPGKLGRIVIKLPMPPSFMLTLYNNDEAFIKKYLSDTPGYYTSGDAGYFDGDGYLNVMTRLDDIINTAGHRLSTAAMEEVLLKHKDVVEAAVVAKCDELKGELPVGFVVIKQGHIVEQDSLEKELVALIRHDIGPVAFFRNALIVDKLPKTRSGKVLRGTLKKIVDGDPYKVCRKSLNFLKIPATIEDESVLEKIKHKVVEYGKGLGEHANIIYKDKIDHIQESVNDMIDQE